jgi:hypothetical protein
MAHAVWKGHIAFGMVSFPYADFADSRRVEEERLTGAYWQPIVSLPRSSNPACGFPALGFPTGFTAQPTEVILNREPSYSTEDRSSFAVRYIWLGNHPEPLRLIDLRQ